MSILKGHTKRNANLAFDILPENILSLISQFAIEVPSALPIADFMFPDQPKEQRQPSFENWFNRLEAQHAIGIEDHYGTASSNASLENLK